MNKLRRLFDKDTGEMRRVTMDSLLMFAQEHEIYKVSTLHDTFFCLNKLADNDECVLRDAYQFELGYIDEIHINPKYIVSWHKLGPGGGPVG